MDGQEILTGTENAALQKSESLHPTAEMGSAENTHRSVTIVIEKKQVCCFHGNDCGLQQLWIFALSLI